MKNKKNTGDLLIAANQKAKEKDYWLTKMSGDPAKTFFPYDYAPNSNKNERKNSKMTFDLPPGLVSQLLAVSQGSPQALHVIFLTALAVLLHRYTGSRDIMVATPVYKQEIEAEYINTFLVIRIPACAPATFKEMLLRTKETVEEAVEHQNYPLEILPEQIEIKKEGDEFPFTDVAILLSNIHDKTYIEHIYPNVLFTFSQNGAGIESKLEYNSLLYGESTIERMTSHFTVLLEQAFGNMEKAVSAVDILSAGEKKRLLEDFNDTAAMYPREKTIQELFEEQVRKNPDYLAAAAEEPETGCIFSLTYGELNRKANQLAAILRKKGVQRGDMVGLLVDRSLHMIVGIFGVLKAGGAYVPIDSRAPAARILTVLEDCNAPLLLTVSSIIEKYSFYDLLAVGRGAAARCRGMRLTGVRPFITDLDCVAIPNRSLVNYEEYHRHIGQSLFKHTISLLGSRGCPFRCAYCHKIWPKKQAARSAGDIFKEVRLYYNMGVRRFVFLDDVFNLNVKSSREFFELIIERGLKLQLSLCLRGDILTPDYIDLMVKAGTVRMALALETASPRLQKLIGKKLNLEKFRENIRYICENYPEVILEINTMHGFPTETEEEALMTLEFIKSLKWIHFPYVNILKIYQNTEMEKLALEMGISAETIASSADLAYHELPETLPFDKSFTREYQATFLNEYFLSKERLLHVLPYQARVLTEDELVQKYDSYLPVAIESFDDLLAFTGISRQELEERSMKGFLDEEQVAVPGFNEKLREHFKPESTAEGAFRVLLLDLSQLFYADAKKREMLYDVVEAPLGLLYIMTYLEQQFGNRIAGRIAKSRVDFENYEALKNLLDEFQPHVIGIRTLTFYRDFFHRTAAVIRDWGIEEPIIAGGPYASSDYRVLLTDTNIDLAVLGEGEITFACLVREMLENRGKLPGEEVLKGIQGLAFYSRQTPLPQTAPFVRQIMVMDNLSPALEKERARARSRWGIGPVNLSTDPAYTIFTSGSTGRPKGVVLDHRNVANLVAGLNDRIYKHYDNPLKVALLSPYIFDASVKQIFGALLLGHGLYIAPEDSRIDGEALFRFYVDHGIDVSDGTPAHLRLLLESANVDDNQKHGTMGVKHFIIGGEALSKELVNDFLLAFAPDPPVITNIYGPTECCVDAASYRVTGQEGDESTIPIGKPMCNHRIYVLDPTCRLLPIGAAGELWIAGAGVARGYLNNPELTEKKFIYYASGIRRLNKSFDQTFSKVWPPAGPYPCPRGGPSEGIKLYKTGDLVKWLPDGNLLFLGRADSQVKIRGYRVELGEIEAQLCGFDFIKEAVVIAAEDGSGERSLCAYIVTGGTGVGSTPLDISEIKTSLTERLPGYMIPLYFVKLERIPLTDNGKIDRKSLPHPGIETQGDFVAPANAVEKKLADLWSEVLNISKDVIDTRSSFFDLGGHSLKAAILKEKVHKELDIRIPLNQIFKFPSIAGLARYIEKERVNRFEEVKAVEKREYYRVSDAQAAVFIQHRKARGVVAYNVPHVLGLGSDVDKERLTRIFKKLIHRHESLRSSFQIIDKKPVQRIHHRRGIEFSVEYGLIEEKRNRVKTIPRDFVRYFDLSRPPLLRAKLLRCEDREYLLAIDMHHIVTDGVSADILREEFMDLYNDEEKPLIPLKIQYKDYTLWRSSKKVKEEINDQKAFWLETFAGEIPVLKLPVDFKRPCVRSFAGDSIEFSIGSELTARLYNLTKQGEATLYMLLLTAYFILLFKFGNPDGIVVGSPVTGRGHVELLDVIGMFVNMLSVRNRPAPGKSFMAFVEEVKVNVIHCLENQGYHFRELVLDLGLQVETGRHPLFDVVFVMQNIGIAPGRDRRPRYGGDREEAVDRGDNRAVVEFPVAKFDLLLDAFETNGKIRMKFEYSTDLFKRDTVARMANHYVEILEQAAADPDILLADIEMSYGLAAMNSGTLLEKEGDFGF